MMLFLLQCLLTIAVWEFAKAWRAAYQRRVEFSKGLRWKCPDCAATEFGSNSAEMVAHMIVDHDQKFHPEKEDHDAQG